MGVELAELVVDLLLEQAGGGQAVLEGARDGLAHQGDEVRAEADCLVVVGDGLFDSLEVAVRGIASLGLSASAEEVEVLASVAAYRALDDHPLQLLPLVPAVSAEDAADKVVAVHPAPLARAAAGVEDGLDAVEEVVVDE